MNPCNPLFGNMAAAFGSRDADLCDTLPIQREPVRQTNLWRGMTDVVGARRQ